MAKDGTNRGGRRVGAGRKPKSTAEKILEGLENPPEKIKVNQNFKPPTPKDHLTAQQKDGSTTAAKQIYRETYAWLKKFGCAEHVHQQLVENFAQVTARHIQAEIELGRTGFLTRHPATGEVLPNPLVRTSLEYLRAAQTLWSQIQAIVKEHGVEDGDSLESNDTMEKILRLTDYRRGGGQ